MTKTQVMKELRANGSAQTRKIARRHGVKSEMFGVSYALLGKLKRKIKTDQRLAEQLWKTGNYDARYLATMIAEASGMTAVSLEAWAKDLEDRHLAAALSNVAAEAPSAKTLTKKWTSARNEMRGCAGWHTLASLARQEKDFGDAYFEEYLSKIETRIHESPNWVRIGVRNPRLEKLATAAAVRIGAVAVDYGETGCKTPEAVSYIKKTVAHNNKKTAKKRRPRT